MSEPAWVGVLPAISERSQRIRLRGKGRRGPYRKREPMPMAMGEKLDGKEMAEARAYIARMELREQRVKLVALATQLEGWTGDSLVMEAMRGVARRLFAIVDGRELRA